MFGDHGKFLRIVKRFTIVAAVLVVAGVGVLFWRNSETETRFGSSSLTPSSFNLITLNCADSAGQQTRDGERVVAGVEGLVLPGSGDPSALSPIRDAHGRRYFVYKAFLAVSSKAAPYATVSIVSPKGATLVYGSAVEVGRLSASYRGQGLVTASRSRVRLPACGSGFTGYVGGIIVVKPTLVTLAVSSPHRTTKRVTISVGTD